MKKREYRKPVSRESEYYGAVVFVVSVFLITIAVLLDYLNRMIHLGIFVFDGYLSLALFPELIWIAVLSYLVIKGADHRMMLYSLAVSLGIMILGILFLGVG